MMMTVTNGDVVPASDGKIWAYYDVNTTELATKLLGATTGIGATMNVDGIDTPRVASYTFSTTGIHLVKFTPTSGTLGRSVFRTIPRVIELYFPNTITRTDGANENVNSISNCSILKKVKFSDNFIRTINNDFAAFPLLEELYIGGITTIGFYCFNNIPNWKGDLCLPHLTSLGDRNFIKCGFSRITDLGSITALSGGANTANAPFVNCTNLTEATLPSTLTTISQYSFYGCTKLSIITLKSVTPPSLGASVFGRAPITSIYVPAESVEAYKTASGWSAYASKIQAI